MLPLYIPLNFGFCMQKHNLRGKKIGQPVSPFTCLLRDRCGMCIPFAQKLSQAYLP